MNARLLALLLVSAALTRCSCGDTPGGDDTPDGATDGSISKEDGSLGDGSSGDGSMVACVDGLEALALSPDTLTVTLDGATPAPITFAASGTFAGGATDTIDPALLAWSLQRDDDTPPGEIRDGVFEPNPAAGGTVTVFATDGCVSAQATVTLFLDVKVGQPISDPDWSGTPVTSGNVPVLVYPSDETRFPRNIYRTLFQWRSGGATEFRLTFEGPNSRITVFTDGAYDLCAQAQPAAGCWEADELAWSYIASSNAGETATWIVDALDRSTTPPTVLRSAPIRIGFSKRDVQGAIFYWSTTSKGIRRGNIRAAVPEDYVTGDPPTVYPDGDEVQCVACHVVSRDGKYIASPVKASSGGSLWIMEVTQAAPPTPLIKSIPDTDGHGFATISPDDEFVVASWGGRMWMLDRATSSTISDLPLGDLEGTHPDWSPDNTQLVFSTGKGDAPGGASLAVMSFDPSTATFGAPSILATPEGDRTNVFPMFSPDGQWIAYAEGKGGHGDNEAQLRLLRANGLAASIELIKANRVVNNETTDGRHQNSQPTWAPPGDLAWIAFNTKRAYGVVLAQGTQQIWVAAVDLAAVSAGADVSFPAFRIPFQGLEENNHRAFWTLDVRDPPPNTDAGVDAGVDAGGDGGIDPIDRDASVCVALGEACDPITDTCCDGAFCDTEDDGVTYTCRPNI